MDKRRQRYLKHTPSVIFAGATALLVIALTSLPYARADQVATRLAVVPAWSIRWQPARLVNGAPVLFRVKPPTLVKSLNGTWLGHDLSFTFEPSTRTWFALAGISLETKPGTYSLTLTAESEKGMPVLSVKRIRVAAGKYHTIALLIPKKFTEPNAAQLEAINQGKSLKDKAFLQSGAQREWSGGFLPPVNAPVSDVFGTRRTFNAAVQSVHKGLDYAVPAGTRVFAVNSGTVILAHPLFFEGNCVVLDHGQGLLTLYLHLSEITVKEGDHIARGQQIGISGATGRATGAHLHVAVRWQGVYLNPATLFSLHLPRT